MRRRILLFFVGVIGLALVAEAGARIPMSTSTESVRWYDAATQLKIEHLDADEYDLVFAGTSMAAQAFDASRFAESVGISAYNASLVGGTPEVMDRWLTEEVLPRTGPETVVWGLSALDLAPAYGPANAAVYDDALASRSGVLADVERAVAPYSVLVSERVVLRDPVQLWGSGESARSRDVGRAFLETAPDGQRTVWTADITPERARVMAARLAGFAPDPDDVDSIIDTIRAIQAEGVAVVLVELPAPDRFVALYPAGSPGHEAVGATLSHIADLTGSRLLRLVDGYTDDDFVDYTHLDERGARALTDELSAAWTTDRDDRSDAEILSAPVASADCETEIVIDEYGFEIEVCALDSEGAAPITEVDLTLDVGLVVDEVLRRVLNDCDGDRPADAIDDEEILQAMPSLTGVLSILDHGRECGDAASVESLAAIAEALSPGLPTDSSIPIEQRLAASLDQWAIDNGGGGFRSFFWRDADELAASVFLQEAISADDPVGVVAVGSSQTAWALDQNELDTHFARPFLNLGQPGMDAEEWEVLSQRLPLGSEIGTVIWSTSTHRMINDSGLSGCLTVARSLDATETRRVALAELVGLNALGSVPLVGADGAADSYRATSLWDMYLDRFEGPGDRRIPDIGFDQVPDRTVRGRYVEPEFCSERLDYLERNLIRLLGNDVTVVLVALPVHAETIALAPDAHAEAGEALELLAEQLGTVYIAPGLLQDEETGDGIHADVEGRARITAELIAVLESEGIR